MNNPSRWTGARRWMAGAAALAAVAALVWAAYRPRPLDVALATVAVGRFEQVIEEDGQLRLQHRYLVSAPTAALLQRPVLQVGDGVKAGDVVAVLAPVAPTLIDARTRAVLQQRVGSAEAARAAAVARVAQLQASLAQATLEAERAAQLAQDRFIAPSARDQARLARDAAEQALRAARAEQAAAEHALGEARAALGRAEPGAGPAPGLWALRSPVDGRVLKRHKESAEPVSAGQPLLEIGDTGAMEAVVDVLSGENDGWLHVLHRVKDGRDVFFLANQNHTGDVRTLSSGISNAPIDDAYAAALKAGALGGKLLGAGGRGFLLVFADPSRHAAVRRRLAALREVRFRFSREGSRIVFRSGEP